MKPIAIFSPVILGLTLLPTAASANLTTPSSLSSLNQEQFNKLGSFKIAQSYVSTQYVSSRLYNSKRQILTVAYEYSGNQVKWKDVEVEQINSQLMKLNLIGKVPVGGRFAKDPNIRVGLYLRRDRAGNFRFIQYDFDVWGGNFTKRLEVKQEKN
ncbi:MAG: hypothetical protein HC836_21875 [Richelia sp. RM2_1_2]|nr:hypothetical protein [Richelia sp. SM2_1_7]NJO60808.1 hypothetical protein [Richelia sp. RM2_1_2]